MAVIRGRSSPLLLQLLGHGNWRSSKKSDLNRFLVLPKRWIVERTFSWLYRNRRLIRDFEKNLACSQAYCLIAMSALMLRRLHAL